MASVRVKLKKKIDQSYEVEIAPGAVKSLIADVVGMKEGRKFAVIADSKVARLHGKDLVEKLEKKKVECELFSFPAGEGSKNWDVALKVAREMLKKKYSRSDVVIALGGGVTGDLAGFVASVFMRGISVIQVPTSLLAMTDAAIGGKTGVNCQEGKNLLGAFHQPLKVYVDVNFLKTLSKKEMQNGYAEIVKHAVIDDRRLFQMIENASENDLFKKLKFVNEILLRSCAVKTRIVTRDEKESRLRMKLNLGHTLGHAIEKEMKYAVAHGAAVSIGLSKICDVAVMRNMLKNQASTRIKNVLKKIGLPTEMPKKCSAAKVIAAMAGDKKVKQKKLYFIVPTKIGKVVITEEVKAGDFEAVL